MHLSDQMGLRARIVILGVILVVPLAALSIARSNLDSRHEFASAKDRARLLVAEANGNYSDLILKAQTAVDLVVRSPETRGDDAAACNHYLVEARSSLRWANTLFVVNADGKRLCSASGDLQMQDVRQRDWFKRVAETKSPIVSDYLIGLVTHKPQITVAAPILDNQGNVLRIVGMGIDLGALNAQLVDGSREFGDSTLIVDRAATVIASYPDSSLYLGKNFAANVAVRTALEQRSGQIEGDWLSGDRQFLAFRPFGDTSLVIITGISKKPIADKINHDLRRDLTILASVVIGCIALALAAANKLILNPLKNMGDAAVAIGHGRFDAAQGMRGHAPELRRTLTAMEEMGQLLEVREQELKEREERYRTLAENTTDLIFRLSADRRFWYISPACRRILGHEPNDLMGSPVMELVHPEDREDAGKALESATNADGGFTLALRFRRQDGHYIWIEVDIGSVPGSAGGGIIAVGRDISSRREAEEALKRSEIRYRTLADNSTDFILLQDGELHPIYSSPASERMLGYTADELPGFDPADIIHRDDVDLVLAAYHKLSAASPILQTTHRLRHKNGHYIWVDSLVRLLPPEAGESGRILTVVRDVTTRKTAEEEAAKAQALVIDAIESMQDAIALYDADERLVLTNKALLDRGDHLPALLLKGRRYEELIRDYWAPSRGKLGEAGFDRLSAERLAHFRHANGRPFESATPDGRWYLSRHFRTSDGGTISVSTEITEAKQAAAQIETARDAAENANTAKSAFLASMSHEIRTPMNGVLGFAELTLLDPTLSAQQRQYILGIQEAGKSLLALINDILDLSKIEAGKLEIERVPTSPEAVIDGAVSILRTQFNAKSLALRIENAPGVPQWIVSDPTRIRQILLNLLSNALKFTTQGHVIVRLRRQDAGSPGLLRFEVEDTGIGISPDRQHLLFRDFSQIDASTTRRFGGTGLGLAICRRLAEAMGGEVGVVSEAGRGSTFWFTVALDETHAPSDPDRPQPSAVVKSAKILVAEDLPANQLVIGGFLKRAGHSSTMVSNGREAVAAALRDRFDLIFMDMEMPEMDGIAATRAIRSSREATATVPIIALTANAMLEDIAACRAAGMNDFLSKPIDRVSLDRAVAQWAGSREGITAPQGPAARSVLDETVINDLVDVLGAEQAREFIMSSQSTLSDWLPLISKWDDVQALVPEIHNMVSIAGNVGCLELGEIAREFGRIVPRPGVSHPIRGELLEAMDRAVSALGRHLESA